MVFAVAVIAALNAAAIPAAQTNVCNSGAVKTGAGLGDWYRYQCQSADVGLIAGPNEVPGLPVPLAQCPPGYYANTYGNCVEDPDQNSGVARCCDGSNSHSQSRSGTCSHHGGVCQWNSMGAEHSDEPDDESPDRQGWVPMAPRPN